ncbi:MULTISPECIES: pentapeptide repeat-containing protein [unclassified Curtobacterium]|uniref:pentapeptide repeat-containing protein n=1 Tax=unclassified Curtobacterium TaxID=257496 RepID=UPI00104933EB|nr:MULTISPECIES: pentapeptide repeat-containing protein [unclassified Curtobacterium]TCL78650.1 pentapeptide repeat protein [Curtobacterium sp. PhB128]TCL95411.1 pentapeptide repeat protein [Curtobacterium sp. PhB138]
MSSSSSSSSPSAPSDRSGLRASCGDCFALCCTAFGFQRSSDFPIDKPAGTPCRNLADDFSCTIHQALRPRGFTGCTTFDCFGAGQYVSQVLFDGTSWVDRPDSKPEMFRAFAVARQLHEMLWYLAEAVSRSTALGSADAPTVLQHRVQQVLDGELAGVLAVDVESLRSEVRSVLIDVSAEARGGYPAAGDSADDLHPSTDLAGRDLRSRVLVGADLRGAVLIAADLRRCDLSGVDLLGADLRDARLGGADLSNALFLTQPQVNAAQGDASTVLPDDLDRPGHWSLP